MGSLMAGWDSPVKDPKSVKYRKNWSFTKGQIDAYWNLKKKERITEDHLKPTSSSSSAQVFSSADMMHMKQDNPDEQKEKRFQRSASAPASKTKKGFMGMEKEADSAKPMKKKDVWWTRSNSAFLNQPPVIERSSNT